MRFSDYLAFSLVLFYSFVSGYTCGANGVIDCQMAGISTGLSISAGNHTLTDCVYRNCKTIIVRNARLNLKNITFVNSLPVDGSNAREGALYMESARLHAENVQFLSTQASEGPGAILADSSELELRNIVARNNVNREGNGGAFFLWKSYANVINLDCKGNSANWGGGCLYMVRGTFECTNCHMERNEAVYRGGAFVASFLERPLRMVNCRFSENLGSETAAVHVSATGNGLFQNLSIFSHRNSSSVIDLSWNSNMAIENSILRDNEDIKRAPLYLWQTGKLQVSNTVFTRNTALESGGIQTFRSEAILNAVEFRENTGKSAGAVDAKDNSTYLFRNCSFTGNAGLNGSVIQVSPTAKAIFYAPLRLDRNAAGPACHEAVLCDNAMAGVELQGMMALASGSYLEGAIFVSNREKARLLPSSIKISDFPKLVLLNGRASKLLFRGHASGSTLEYSGPRFPLDELEVLVGDPFGNPVSSEALVSLVITNAEGGKVYSALQDTANGVAVFNGKSIQSHISSSGTFKLTAQAMEGISDPEECFFSVNYRFIPTDASGQNGSGTLIITVAASVSAFGILVSVAAAIFVVRRRRHFNQLRNSSASSRRQSEMESVLKKGDSATINATKTQSPSTKSVALAIPGYMKRGDRDFVVFLDQGLGRGATAVIYRGVLSADLEKSFAFKEIAVKVFQSGALDLRDVKFELALLTALQKKSRHILELVGYHETADTLKILLKLYEHGTLGSKIHDPRFHYPEGFVTNTVNGIIKGMSLVHSHGIVHFDVKPANILLDFDYTAVISDFGMSKTIGSAKTVTGLASSTVSGYTPNFAAPELLRTAPGGLTLEIDKKVDVYAFAITVWELLHRKGVWSDPNGKSVSERVHEGERPALDPVIANRLPELVDLIQQSWEHIPHKRPSFSAMPVFQ